MSMNQNGNDIVNKNICGSNKKSIIQTDNGGGGKKLKDFPSTSNPFGRLFAKHRNEDEFLMSIEILFHIRTPEKNKVPSNKLHVV